MFYKLKTKLLLIAALFLVFLGVKLFVNSSLWQTDVSFNLYFINNELSVDNLDCTEVFPVSREELLPPHTNRQLLVINSLIKGLTETEKDSGYSSLIDPETKVNSVAVDNEIIIVDLSEALENNSGGSCRAEAIRSQIENTLKQFEGIEKVVISVNADFDNILQP